MKEAENQDWGGKIIKNVEEEENKQKRGGKTIKLRRREFKSEGEVGKDKHCGGGNIIKLWRRREIKMKREGLKKDGVPSLTITK